MNDRSDNLSHNEQTLLPSSYISLPGSMETGKSAGSVKTPGTSNTRVVEAGIHCWNGYNPGTGNTGSMETGKSTGSEENPGTANTGDVEIDNSTGTANTGDVETDNTT